MMTAVLVPMHAIVDVRVVLKEPVDVNMTASVRAGAAEGLFRAQALPINEYPHPFGE